MIPPVFPLVLFTTAEQTISLPVVTWTNSPKLLSGVLAKLFICVLVDLCGVFSVPYVSRLLIRV